MSDPSSSTGGIGTALAEGLIGGVARSIRSPTAEAVVQDTSRVRQSPATGSILSIRVGGVQAPSSISLQASFMVDRVSDPTEALLVC